MEPLTTKRQKNIVNNVLAACKDIHKLNRQGYSFLCLCPGFIAHYDIHGFIAYYATEESLKADILAFQGQNQWCNFRPGERDYEYYRSKADTYNAICKGLKGGL